MQLFRATRIKKPQKIKIGILKPFYFQMIIHWLAWSISTELHVHHCRDSNSYQIKIRESACFKIECLFCYSSFLSSSSPNLFNLIDMSNISPKSQYQGNNFRQNTGYILFQRKLIFLESTQITKNEWNSLMDKLYFYD